MTMGRSERLLEILRAQGLTELPEPVQLASGNYSRYFIDGKVALGADDDLRLGG
ncbi:MAG: hypothetical protein OXH86_08020 [Acidimicrobiaceae bacterium]|nr:hypothetical protein [Acidimicrobiaceae bacterium]